MLKLNHKNLDVYKLSIDFVSKIYEITDNYSKNEVYGLSSQLRRAAVSIPSNIAEGSARKSSIERRRFYEISRSSLVEVISKLKISIKIKYVPLEHYDSFEENIVILFNKISSLITNTI